jgi:hypothetical protein
MVFYFGSIVYKPNEAAGCREPLASAYKQKHLGESTGPTSNWKALAIAVLLRLGDF